MSYCTLDDLLDRYGEDELYIAFDRVGDGVLDQAAIDRALVDADEEINTYLATCYNLPLATVPPVLTRLAAQIAMYHGSIGPAMTDEKRRRYDDAIAALKTISKGGGGLGLPTADEPPSREQLTVTSSAKVFTDSELEKF